MFKRLDVLRIHGNLVNPWSDDMDNNLGLTGISAVCFDAFGTLIEYGGPRLNPYRRLLERAPDKQTGRLSFLTRDVGVEVFAREWGLEDELPAIQRELSQELAGLRLYSEVDNTLHTLQRAGKRVAVCSNLAAAYGPTVRKLLPELDAHVLSFECGVAKPDPAIYHTVCTALRCSPGELLFIGDSQRCDLHGPQSVGMSACWLDREHGDTLLTALAI
jgi:HAD superfamily hydrolase (TIGR01509 family)